MMRNKKGQIDKIITLLPVGVLIVIVMGVFVYLSASVFQFNKPQQGNSIVAGFVPLNSDSLLFESINVNGRSEFVVDALLDFRNFNLERGDFVESLRPFLQGSELKRGGRNCLGVAYGSNLEGIWNENGNSADVILRVDNGEIRQYASLLDVGFNQSRQIEFSFLALDNDQFYVASFYDNCDLLGGRL